MKQFADKVAPRLCAYWEQNAKKIIYSPFNSSLQAHILNGLRNRLEHSLQCRRYFGAESR